MATHIITRGVAGAFTGQAKTRAVWFGTEPLTPDESLKHRNHSLDGFSWGYGGSGPSQLALAVLLKVTDPETALSLYQQFKWDHVANWPSDGDWLITVAEVKRWLAKAVKEGR